MWDRVVREAVNEIRFHFAQLDTKVRLINAERDNGGGAESVAQDNHRERDWIKLEVSQIVHRQVRQG